MNTRLLGAAVLIALAVLFIPMFFSSKPPAESGDAAVSLAIPPAPDRDLQTRTMDLSTSGTAPTQAQAQAPVSGDQLATVNIASNRPLDVENDPRAGKAHEPTTVSTGTGTSVTEPVIPMQTATRKETPAPTTPVAADEPVATKPAAPAKTEAAPAPAPKPAPKPAEPAPHVADAGGQGSYMINLSAYASASGAAALQQKVRALGYPVSSHAITQAGQRRTKVVAGPFATRTAAEAARLKITHSISGVPATLEHSDAQASSASPTTSAHTVSASKAGGWAVQLAAMSGQADANALRDRLRAAGFDGFVDSVNVGGKQLWRVRAGPQTQRADAQRVHDQIKAKLGIDGNIVSVP
ncbi:MAG TPA: SPOR domain-containing protein [Rhodanobacter sp.]|nr:SPOR domain-containing protein [Rhodanobacter sp.]